MQTSIKYYQLLEVLREKDRVTATSIEAKGQVMEELRVLLKTIEGKKVEFEPRLGLGRSQELSEHPETGREVDSSTISLAPIGCGAFLKAKILDVTSITIFIGADTWIDLKFPEAEKFVLARIKDLEGKVEKETLVLGEVRRQFNFVDSALKKLDLLSGKDETTV